MSEPLTTRRDLRASERRPAPPLARTRAVVGTILLVVVSLFALVAVVIPLLMGAQTYTVLTGSMQPGMPPGTLIAVRQTPIEAVRVGDVVTYQIRSGDPAVVTHRVVGTTSSTGGDRLLITRGDANDADDPPVQREQLRGTVVLAVPYLGYPGVLIGGQERGALVVAVGIAVVGYGAALLTLDLVRSRRERRGGPAVVLAVVAAAACLPLSLPDAAHAAPLDRLLISDDGVSFVANGSVSLFDDAGLLVPGETVGSTVWIRNAGADPARAGLRLDAVPRTDDPGDRALAEAVRLVVASSAVPAGEQWVSEVIPAGGTVRLDVGLALDAASGNDSRRSAAVVTPVVRLTEATGGSPGALPPAGTLPSTGLPAASLAVPVLLAGVAAFFGLTLRARWAKRRT
ncbi:signal peptidase I [Microbacterium sp. PRF11]|uniref:signal peptidase I n=1 Tax=Microbacterium sp. PRF11 TaxID=2962593 RepID=UPI00288128E5|nr:signal peptidase I [Microbacterium sp. PRF11]MDT0117935.1 signal peptidase I [Microbacterium sp. PRF11]